MGPKTVMRFNTAVRNTMTGSSGAFYGPVYNLVPNSTSVTEAVALAALFDEARCVSVTFHCRVTGSAPATANNSAWGVVYDSANSGGYSSVIGTLIGAQHMGPIAINDVAGAQTVAQTKTGYYSWKVKVPPNAPTAGGGVASEQVGSNWFATQDVNACVGYLKWAVDATSSVTYTVDAQIVYHMEYRMRT